MRWPRKRHVRRLSARHSGGDGDDDDDREDAITGRQVHFSNRVRSVPRDARADFPRALRELQ